MTVTAPRTPSPRTTAVRWAVPLALAALIWLLPAPTGLSPAAWHYAALFLFVVAALITEPIPAPIVGFIGVSVAAVFQLVAPTPAASVRWALSGFSNDVVWLIFAATTFAMGYEVTGLGRRVALLLVRRLGTSTLGLGYAIASADLILGPFMPSNTARSAGTIYPVVKSIPALYDSSPSVNPRAIGAYLCWTAFASTCVTSATFATAMAPNLFTMQLAGEIAGVRVDWATWLRGALPLGVLLFLVTPAITYLVYPPTVKRASAVIAWADAELRTMGRISRRELTMAALAVLALVGWIFAGPIVPPVIVALIVISLMVTLGVVSWNEILANQAGWNVLVWFATLVAMADGLNQVGFLSWVATSSAAALGGFPVMVSAVSMIALYFLIHYLFASTTAHATAVLPPFLVAVVAIPDMPVRPVVLALLYSLGLMGVLTPYGTGPAPVWAGAGYISTRAFWLLGAFTAALYLAALLAVELPYLLYTQR